MPGPDNTIAGPTPQVLDIVRGITNLEAKTMKSAFVYGPTFAEMRDPSRIKPDVRKQALTIEAQRPAASGQSVQHYVETG